MILLYSNMEFLQGRAEAMGKAIPEVLNPLALMLYHSHHNKNRAMQPTWAPSHLPRFYCVTVLKRSMYTRKRKVFFLCADAIFMYVLQACQYNPCTLYKRTNIRDKRRLNLVSEWFHKVLILYNLITKNLDCPEILLDVVDLFLLVNHGLVVNI